MPKYMFQASLTEKGLKGLLKEGGTSRVKAIEQALEPIGGSLEAYYFAFGDSDVFVIVNLPDNVNATAASLVSNAAGAFNTKTIVLITPEEVDKATEVAKEMGAAYRPPGH